jgi:hypothetical protein
MFQTNIGKENETHILYPTAFLKETHKINSRLKLFTTLLHLITFMRNTELTAVRQCLEEKQKGNKEDKRKECGQNEGLTYNSP